MIAIIQRRRNIRLFILIIKSLTRKTRYYTNKF